MNIHIVTFQEGDNQRVKAGEKPQHSHFFSSYFYQCLTEYRKPGVGKDSNIIMYKFDHKTVTRWRKGNNIFEDFDKMYCPINISNEH